MSNPLISVCIPAYNADPFLAETLATVAAQSYINWEVIVLEDGSKDRAEAIVHEFAGTVKQRVVYLRHSRNRGLAAARNSGNAEARGEWIALLDADDLWEPTHLEALVNAAGNCDVVCSASSSFDSVTRRRLEDWAQTDKCIQTFPVSLYDGQMTILPSSAMLRRSVFKEYGPVSERYRVCNDTELFFRLASRGARFAFTRKTTCRYRRHASSMSRAHTNNLIELAQIYEEFAHWEKIPRALRQRKAANVYRYAGRSAAKTDIKLARALYKSSLKLRVTAPSTWYFYLKSFLPIKRAAAGESRLLTETSPLGS